MTSNSQVSFHPCEDHSASYYSGVLYPVVRLAGWRRNEASSKDKVSIQLHHSPQILLTWMRSKWYLREPPLASTAATEERQSASSLWARANLFSICCSERGKLRPVILIVLICKKLRSSGKESRHSLWKSSLPKGTQITGIKSLLSSHWFGALSLTESPARLIILMAAMGRTSPEQLGHPRCPGKSRTWKRHPRCFGAGVQVLGSITASLRGSKQH